MGSAFGPANRAAAAEPNAGVRPGTGRAAVPAGPASTVPLGPSVPASARARRRLGSRDRPGRGARPRPRLRASVDQTLGADRLLRETISSRQEQLLRCAYRAMGERGVQRVPLQEIAAAAGVSKGVVLYHFKSKENLILTMMRWVLDQAADRIRHAMARSQLPESKVLAMIEAIFVGPQVNRHFYLTYLDLVDHAARVDSFGQLSATFRSIVNGLYAEVIEQGVAEGAFQVGDAEEAAAVVRAIIEGLFLQWLQEEDWVRRHGWYREICKRAVLAYLMRPAGAEAGGAVV